MKQFLPTLILVFLLQSCGGVLFEKSVDDYHEKLGKKAALFPVYSNTQIPDEVRREIEQKLYTSAKSTGFFDRILDAETVNRLKNSDGELSKNMDVYFGTFNSVSVSDWDLASVIGKKLESDTFLIFQISLWPCQNCAIKDRIRMKYRIVTPENGKVIWISIDDTSNLDGEPEELSQEGLAMVGRLNNELFHRFKEKWHKLRFKNLSM